MWRGSVNFREDIIWAAGLLEGEGCFTVHSKTHPYLLLDMTDKDVVEKLYSIFPFGNFRGPYIHHKRPEHKPRWRFDAFGPSCYAIMVMVYPFMGNRRQEKIKQLIRIWTDK